MKGDIVFVVSDEEDQVSEEGFEEVKES